MSGKRVQIGGIALLLGFAQAAVAESPRSATTVAADVDRLIDASLPAEVERAPRTNDEDFLRRITLDLAGALPSPSDVTAFGLDPDPDKRARMIDRLLESPEYARTWARYWSDVVYTNATEERARITQGTFETWLEEQFAANRPWDEVATELLTATGGITEDGRTALIFAHTGQPAELAAETSRIFLGIQIQCANCHDHPTDSWTREQFHELAAFFPRIRVRPETAGDVRSFVVESVNVNQGRRGQVRPAVQPGRGAPEYYMPDLNNPSSRGTRVQPVFFVDGTSLEAGTSDLDRRTALAQAITSPENEWFSKAFVNRVWGELTGRGFYTPIDDIGPLRAADCEDALQALADGFTAQGYDVQWLYRTIANTETYQRQIRTPDPAAETPPFASAMPARLRADQVYNSLTKVLGVEQLAGAGGRRRGGFGMNRDPGRTAFAGLFGFDPSMPQEDIVGSIPQALYLMNSPQVGGLIRGNGNTRLGRILRNHADNADALAELYVLTLAREPSAEETSIALDYVEEVGNRTEAFEDLFWSLLNSSEFLSRR